MIDLSASGRPSEDSAIIALERARKASILKASCAGVGAPLHIGQIEGVERGVRIGREPDVHAAEGLDEISVLASGVEDDDLVLRIGEHCIGDLAFHREGLPGTGLAATNPMDLRLLRLQITRLPDCFDCP